MLHKGPVPRFVHGVWEYAIGVLLVVSQFVFGFEDGGAKAVSVVAGVLIITLVASTEGPTGLIDQVMVRSHAVMDYVLAGLLIAAPFLFGFTDDGAATAVFLVLGLAHLLISIATRYLPSRAEATSRA
jgi:hypothetical protein